MAAGKFGPASGLLLVDGYNIIANKITSLTEKATSMLTDITGLGDSYTEQAPIGRVTSEVVQDGAFFDTTALYSHAAFSGSVPTSPQATARVMCLGMAGQTSGYPMVGYEGTYSDSYEVVAELGDLQKANVTYTITGKRSAGVIVNPLVTYTGDWNTISTSVDNSASSSSGGVGFIQCTAASSFSDFEGVLKHSSDDTSYVTLITFTRNVTAPYAERKTVSGTVNRYLAFYGSTWGSGSITIFCGFSRG